MLRVASYNIHKGIGLDRRRDPARILSVIAELDPDIIALQEADRRLFGRRAVLDPAQIRQAGYRHADFDMRPQSIGWHGNAILVRAGLKVRHAEPLWLETLEPRGAVLAEVETSEGLLRVIGMHLDLSGLYRVRQLRGLLETLDLRKPMPTLLMGDTNDWNRGRRAAMPTLPERYRMAACGPSFHTRRPVLELDRIIMSDDLDASDCGVHDTALSKRASDHMPIWANVALVS